MEKIYFLLIFFFFLGEGGGGSRVKVYSLQRNQI